ncbi:hypothetical protein ACTUHY_00395 [Acidaminococcus sp. LBK-2]|uniref:hypothetical protein n=1 Tax=Acidaminococcus sp. LBK-2 TaxID=3456956 RepID=UPI003FA4A25A
MTTYKVVRNFVAHAGKLVGPGGHVNLKDQEAKHLLAAGQIALDETQPKEVAEAAEAPEEAMTLPDATPELIKPPVRKRK